MIIIMIYIYTYCDCEHEVNPHHHQDLLSCSTPLTLVGSHFRFDLTTENAVELSQEIREISAVTNGKCLIWFSIGLTTFKWSNQGHWVRKSWRVPIKLSRKSWCEFFTTKISLFFGRENLQETRHAEQLLEKCENVAQVLQQTRVILWPGNNMGRVVSFWLIFWLLKKSKHTLHHICANMFATFLFLRTSFSVSLSCEHSSHCSTPKLCLLISPCFSSPKLHAGCWSQRVLKQQRIHEISPLHAALIFYEKRFAAHRRAAGRMKKLIVSCAKQFAQSKWGKGESAEIRKFIPLCFTLNDQTWPREKLKGYRKFFWIQAVIESAPMFFTDMTWQLQCLCHCCSKTYAAAWCSAWWLPGANFNSGMAGLCQALFPEFSFVACSFQCLESTLETIGKLWLAQAAEDGGHWQPRNGSRTHVGALARPSHSTRRSL